MHARASFSLLGCILLRAHLTISAPTSAREDHVGALGSRALGINCRGSFVCGGNFLDDIVSASANIDQNKVYQNGEHILCAIKVGNIGECAFLQNTANGISGSEVQRLLKEILNHKCKDCGSVPITFPGSNDPKDGILTVNYVDDVGGNCHSDDHICDTARPAPPPPVPTTAVSSAPVPSATATDLFDWTVVGDSYSSGVSYDGDTTYPGGDKCFRSKESWGAQMEADNSWTVSQQHLTFQACAGDKTDAIKGQIDNGGTPGLVISTIGGNNAFFGQIVRDCIYQPRFQDITWQPNDAWDQDADGTGRCKKSLAQANSYIASASQGLAFDFKNALDDIFNSNAAHSHPTFWLWIMSYAQFFDAATDDCDKWSFASWQYSPTQPKAVKGLRKDMNDALVAFTRVQQDVHDKYTTPNAEMKLSFENIDEHFAGHRFCEQGKSYNDQFYHEDTWFWNLQYFNSLDDVAAAGKSTAPMDGTNATLPLPDAVPGTLSVWPFELAKDDPQLASLTSPYSEGWKLRPFHPKKPGNAGLKNAIINAMRAAKVPGVKDEV